MYRKIPIISPGIIFVQKVFLLGLFSGELINGGAYYWKEFCVSKWVGLDNKNSLKHYENSLKQLKTANRNRPWAYIREGILSEGFLRLRFWGLIFGKAYYYHYPFSFFFFGGGLIMGILRYDLFVLSVVCRGGGGGGDIVLAHHAVSVHKQSKKELG